MKCEVCNVKWACCAACGGEQYEPRLVNYGRCIHRFHYTGRNCECDTLTVTSTERTEMEDTEQTTVEEFVMGEMEKVRAIREQLEQAVFGAQDIERCEDCDCDDVASEKPYHEVEVDYGDDGEELPGVFGPIGLLRDAGYEGSVVLETRTMEDGSKGYEVTEIDLAKPELVEVR